MKDRIEKKLKAILEPTSLEVIDDSSKHMGHSGNTLSGESHFIVRISASSLSELSKVKAHQMIFEILKVEMLEIHALNIEIF
ncbi:MAG: BolA family protein [Alphaproteobacteria bacterium]|jgi:BolA protein|nr:BolA family transcriptional regulator [Candidatus Jidaibacter sp.]